MVEYLAGNRIRGTDAERLAIGSVSSLTDSGISKSNCKAYYNFEQTSGDLTNIATTSNGYTNGLGSSADGTNNGATTGQTGKVGYAWSFDNSNDYVNTNISTGYMDTPNSFSISMWINPDTSSSWNDILIGQNVTGTDRGIGFWLNSLKPTVYFEDSGAQYGIYTSGGTVSAVGTWSHVVLTVVGQTSRSSDSTGIKIYINGTSQSITASGSGTTGTISPNNIMIGTKNGTGSFYDGLTDELSIWDRVLTASEVSTLYQETYNIIDGSIFYTTDTNKEYILSNNTWTEL
jgi:hypothetical protein